MNLFSRFSRKTLKPAWSYTSPSPVWRILFGGEFLVGESRDQEQRTASFFCVDGTSGNLRWAGKTLAEPWWVGIEAIHRDVILFHGYEQPDLPGHKGVEARDLQSGEPLWRHDDHTYWFSYRDRVYVYQTLFEKRIGFALDLRSGQLVDRYDKGMEELSSIRQLALQEAAEEGMMFPEVLTEESAPKEVRELLGREGRGKAIIGGIEFLSEHPYLITNYHLAEQDSAPETLKLENHLAIFDMNSGAPLYRAVLVSGAAAPVPDSFFVRDGILYYIRDQRILEAVRLSEVPREGS